MPAGAAVPDLGRQPTDGTVVTVKSKNVIVCDRFLSFPFCAVIFYLQQE